MRFFSHVPRNSQTKNSVPKSKAVLCSPCIDTNRQTRKWLLWAPFQGFRSFSFNLSSRIGPTNNTELRRCFGFIVENCRLSLLVCFHSLKIIYYSLELETGLIITLAWTLALVVGGKKDLVQFQPRSTLRLGGPATGIFLYFLLLLFRQ